MHVWSKRAGHKQCCRPPPCFSPMLMVPVRECVTVKPMFSKQEQTVPYAHDNHNLHIKCFLCGAFLKNLLQFFVQVYSFCCEWKKTIMWEPMMLFKLSQCCKWFSFKETLKCCLETERFERFEAWRLKTVFSSPCKLKKQTHPHVPTIHLDLNCSCFHFFILLCSVLCVLQFSYIFFYVIWCYPLLWYVICVAYTDLHV